MLVLFCSRLISNVRHNFNEMISRKPFLVLASLAYALYVLSYCMGVGFDVAFWQVDWAIFAKLCLLAFPIYIYLGFRFNTKLFWYDLLFLLIPYIIWFLSVLFIPKSLINGFIVEPEILFLLFGLYFSIIPLSNLKLRISRKMICSLLAIFLSIGAWAVAYVVPALPE